LLLQYSLKRDNIRLLLSQDAGYSIVIGRIVAVPIGPRFVLGETILLQNLLIMEPTALHIFHSTQVPTST
jgi:uncharacterized membrane protein